jgi:hypothetical protein
MVNATLQDATTMTVRGNFNTIGSNSIVNKLGGKSKQAPDNGDENLPDCRREPICSGTSG